MGEKPPTIVEFDYRPNPRLVSGLFLLALAGTALFGYFSFRIEGGANIRGVALTEQQLRWLFRVLLVLSPIGLAALGSAVYVAWFGRQRIALTRESLLVPKPTRLGLTSEELEIAFAEILDVSVRDFIGSARVLRIEHAAGEVSIASNMFRSKRTFDEVVQRVETTLDDFRRSESSDPNGFSGTRAPGDN
jgi:hypothetical protein